MGGHKRRKNNSRKKREPTRPPFGGIELKWPPLAFTLNHLRDKVRRIVQQGFLKETTTEQSRETEQGKKHIEDKTSKRLHSNAKVISIFK